MERDFERTVRSESEAQLEKSRATSAAAEARRKVMRCCLASLIVNRRALFETPVSRDRVRGRQSQKPLLGAAR